MKISKNTISNVQVIPFDKILKKANSNSLWVYSYTLNNENSPKLEELHLVDILPVPFLLETNKVKNVESLKSFKLNESIEENLKLLKKKLAFKKLLEAGYSSRKSEEAQAELLRQMTKKERIAYLRKNSHLIFLAFLLGLITLKFLIKLLILKKERIKRIIYKLRNFSKNKAYQIFLISCVFFFCGSFIILLSSIFGFLSFYIMSKTEALVKLVLSIIGIAFEEDTIINKAINIINPIFYGAIFTYILKVVNSI